MCKETCKEHATTTCTQTYKVWNSPRDTTRCHSFIARSRNLDALQIIFTSRKAVYVGIRLCKVNEAKTYKPQLK